MKEMLKSIFVLVLLAIIFTIKFYALTNFVDDYRKVFHELIDKYPSGEQPEATDWHLTIPYVLIKQRRCCGIDSTDISLDKYSVYFMRNFPQTCLVAQLPGDIFDDPFA